MGGTRGEKGLIIKNYTIIKIVDSGDIGQLHEIHLLEEDGSRICGALVSGGAMFCMLSIN